MTNWPPGLRGIDVSYWQKYVDYKRAATENGLSFAIIKATQNISWTDPRFKQHWKGFGPAEPWLLRSPYHFFDPRYDGLRQATHFCNVVETTDIPPELPHVVDLERFATDPDDPRNTNDLETHVWVDGALETLAEVERRSGHVPLLYIGGGFFHELLNGYTRRDGKQFDPAPRAMELTHYPLWLADYKPPARDMPWPGKWTLWQFTGKGKVAGVKGNCDMNVFCGTSEEQLCNLMAPRLPRRDHVS